MVHTDLSHHLVHCDLSLLPRSVSKEDLSFPDLESTFFITMVTINTFMITVTIRMIKMKVVTIIMAI